MEGRTQYGLAMCCHFEDYLSGAIKKHELTRTEKEEDRMIHVRNQQANIEPVFFAYPDNAEIDAIVADVVANNAPEYDFTAEDGFGHKLWVIRDRKTNLYVPVGALDAYKAAPEWDDAFLSYNEEGEQTGVEDVAASKQVASVEYYSVSGIKNAEPVDGVNIKVVRYTDGSLQTSKFVK